MKANSLIKSSPLLFVFNTILVRLSLLIILNFHKFHLTAGPIRNVPVEVRLAAKHLAARAALKGTEPEVNLVVVVLQIGTRFEDSPTDGASQGGAAQN